MRITVSEVVCPDCGAEEMHPDGDKLLVRGFKVHDEGHWWSQCLVCSGFYNPDLTVAPEGSHDSKKGWF